jgi:hypothetical protein
VKVLPTVARANGGKNRNPVYKYDRAGLGLTIATPDLKILYVDSNETNKPKKKLFIKPDE